MTTMLRSKESNKKMTNTNSFSTSTNSLVQGTTVEGTIISDNDIRIDGRLIGNLNCKGKVIIGSTGSIEGEIECQNAVVEGFFNGLLVVSELLHVKESAKISGDVHTKKLVVQSGSIFNVTCKMGGQKVNKSSKKVDDNLKEEISKVLTS